LRFIGVLDPLLFLGWWILRKTLGRDVDGLCLVDLRLESKSEQIELREHLHAALDTLRERDPRQFDRVIRAIKFVAAVGVPRPQVVLKHRAYFSPFTASDSSNPLWLACVLAYTASSIEQIRATVDPETAKQVAAARAVEILDSSPAELELRKRLLAWQGVTPTA